MNKRKIQKKDKILLGVLAALIVIVIGAGAFLIIKNTNDANEEAKKLTPTSSTSATSETKSTSSKTSSKTGSKTSSSKTSSNTSSASSSSSSSSDAGTTTSSKTSSAVTSSKTPSNTTSVKGDKVKRVKPKENTSHASKQTLKVNDKTCYVGDTVTVVLNITSQKSIVNYQGTLNFDSKYLKVKEVKSNDFGLANVSGSDILFNASAINGMNFSETGTVFTATVEVLSSGSTTLKENMEIISELINNNIHQLSPTDYKVSIEIYD